MTPRKPRARGWRTESSRSETTHKRMCSGRTVNSGRDLDRRREAGVERDRSKARDGIDRKDDRPREEIRTHCPHLKRVVASERRGPCLLSRRRGQYGLLEHRGGSAV